MERSCNKKVREGIVVSNKMAKTIVVKVERTLRHPDFHKVITRAKKYYAHTESNVDVGAKVRIIETRPLSKLKCWRLLEVLP